MQQIITSLHNPRVKGAARLRDRRGRERQGRIIIDGLRELRRADQGGVQWVDVFVCEPLCPAPDGPALIDQLEQRGAKILSVSPEVFAKIAFGRRCEGLVGVALTPSPNLADLALPDRPLIAVLEGVEKPGNMGAVIRSADGAGVDAVVVTDGRTDLYNPNTIRASLGTVFGPGVCAASCPETIDWLRRLDAKLLVARVDGATCYTEVDYRQSTAIVLGSEAAGLSDAWRTADMLAVKLPMGGVADSLNVSAAAAVLFYEARRQRDRLLDL